MNNALPVKPRTKTVRLATKVATVYFPSSWTGYKQCKQWLRARKFSATDKDVGFTRRGVEVWASYGHCRTVEKSQLRESFAGASLVSDKSVMRPEDILATFSLLLETFKPRFAKDSLPLPELRLKSTRRGWAYTNRRDPWFSLPAWTLTRCEDWVIYYMAHELAHHAFGGINHGDAMCRVEEILLAPFGIKIEYRGGRGLNNPWYPARLFRPDGTTICGAHGSKIV